MNALTIRRLTLAEPFARPHTASLLQDLIAAEMLADVVQEQRSLGFTPGALPTGGVNPATLAALAQLQKLKGGIMTLMQDGIPRTTREIADHTHSNLDATRNAAKCLVVEGRLHVSCPVKANLPTFRLALQVLQ